MFFFIFGTYISLYNIPLGVVMTDPHLSSQVEQVCLMFSYPKYIHIYCKLPCWYFIKLQYQPTPEQRMAVFEDDDKAKVSINIKSIHC